MRGMMMDMPLTITEIMRHAQKYHADRQIISVTVDDPRHRISYGEAFRRTRKLANALSAMGLERGARVATLAWNDYRHFEMYYAISCSGLVCHTINPRLFEHQLEYIINHAEDQVIFVDPLVLPVLEKIADQLPAVRQVVVACEASSMPQTRLPNAVSYETLIADQSDQFDWPQLDEHEACSLCYTSGTTGNPKGVLYSHRSTVLHAMMVSVEDVVGGNSSDTILPVVPMFHVNAWGTPYSAPMLGCNLVLPGPKMGDGETLATLMNEENVTLSLGVPTVWLSLLQYCQKNDIRLESLKRTVVGGAACPLAIMDAFREQHDVHVHQGWGMTEMSPVGTYNTFNDRQKTLPLDERRAIQALQGRGLFGVQMKIVDEADQELPWDNEAFGRLKVRGYAVCSGYYRHEQSDTHDADGWFDTGDVAAVTSEGYLRITDRTKDVIKSGGEWISSIDLENAAMAHDAVAEAAVIGLPHPKWTERPLLVAVRAAGTDVDGEAILGFLKGKVASWWIPDDVVFVDDLPHTATGKVSKLTLRQQFADYSFPESEGQS